MVGLLLLTISLAMVPKGQAAGDVDQTAEGLPEPGSELGPSVRDDVLGDGGLQAAYRWCELRGDQGGQ